MLPWWYWRQWPSEYRKYLLVRVSTGTVVLSAAVQLPVSQPAHIALP
jgi:hypothetical protein